MKVSVIIPTYNEERVIGKCLVSLSQQTYKDMEIVVVDDGSTDETKLKISHFVKLSLASRGKQNAKLQIKNLKILEQEHKGPGAARNLGASRAGGEILVFVDSDMTFEKDFIEKLVVPIMQGKTKGTWSREEYVSNWDNVWARCWNINEGWEERKRHPKGYPDEQKVFRAILKSEFDRVEGFSLVGYNDDWTLSEKLGYKAQIAPGAKFYHENPGSLGGVFQQSRWIGKRKYKLGRVGSLIAAVRASFPISFVVGAVKSIVSGTPQFLIFKIVYDFGVFLGAIESFLGGRNAK